MGDKNIIRGNLQPFLRGGVLVLAFGWIATAVMIVYFNKGFYLQRQIECFLMYAIICLFIALVIKIQRVIIDGDNLIYSRNFFPLLTKKIPILSIAKIAFGKSFMPIADPTPISKISMAKKDFPIVGLRILNKEGNILGGINTKVFLHKDIGLVIKRIKEINPQVELDDFCTKLIGNI